MDSWLFITSKLILESHVNVTDIHVLLKSRVHHQIMAVCCCEAVSQHPNIMTNLVELLG